MSTAPQRRLASLLVLSAFAPTAWTQETAAADPAQVIVSGTSYRTTGTKSDLKPIEAPMSYEVYGNEQLTARQADSVNEALRYVPGVTPESRPTVTIFDQYTIRGFESYRNYYDGLPLQYNGLWNLAPQVDVFATDSVEILKGPASVLYGSAPPGGMVNQTAKLPRSRQETAIRARAGTNDLRELGVDSTGPLSKDVDYRLVALVRERDGQQATTKEERRLVAPSVTWRIGPATRLHANLYYQDDPALIPSTPLPALGTLRQAPYGLLAPDTFAGDAGWSGMTRETTMAGWKFEHAFNDSVKFLQNFRYTKARGLQRNTYNNGLLEDDRTLTRSAYFTDERQHGYVVDNQLSFRLGTGALVHRLLAGADYQKLRSTVGYGDTLGTDTPSIDLGNPDHFLFDSAALPFDFYTERHAIRQSQLGLYVQDEIRVGALTLVGGLRRDRYRSEDANASSYAGSPSAATTAIAQEKTSGRAAAIYRFGNGMAPYLNYSTSFEPASGVDSLTGQAFKPTTAKQIEAGVKYKSPDSRTELTAAWFDIRKQNVVVNTPTFNQYTQNGEVRSTGIELSWNQALTERLDFTLGLTHLDMEVTKNALDPALVGKTPVWVADKGASLWLTYTPLDTLDLSAGIRHVGASQMDEANTAQVPSYTLFDAAAMFRLNRTWSIGLTASNLGDKRYVGACHSAQNCWMGAERSVELTVHARF
ncbi:TonB-dependent siderophore receptor [Pseudoduganella albidiflava]|uniref:Ligand-gated channel protein n=1 Tax=Pseudoduganella albidiflava TaxID=321983 RepID=A0A411X1E3_9BURK|nr:TonB-dependent siderophore receptor [Pseudoduganella albidiflava]QBI02783.1 TonB-dependent siderophore receptor [Pseudoduganella albidiflava]GGY56253.1 ligand-gated channel protein [Pseudoduganella albidiflava]